MPLNERIQGKVIIVTGAAGGIGRAISRRVAREGGSLVLCDLNATALEAVADEIRKSGDTTPVAVEVVPGDARDPVLGTRLVERAIERFGRINGLVPCAGIIHFTPVLKLDLKQWEAVMNLNLRGTFFTLQAVANAMIAHKCGGSIVTISSTSSEGPRPDCSDYAISRAGINHLTRTFALQMAPHGVRVNAVSPGVIETAMWTQVDRERGAMLGLEPGELSRRIEREIPLGRAGRPDDVADVVSFLLSDESSYITGQNITIDGGFRLNHV